jgi:hypothetical protein
LGEARIHEYNGCKMAAMNLGRLERVELRQVWQDESGDFTPWLAKPDNLKLLGDAVGMDLEFEAQEKSVGPFKADILCKDTASEKWVLIENQLEQTDHKHLGQLLTYAAGLKAVTIVWIAKGFTEEHRAALDWLNEITNERFDFFGLEVELWRIGESAIATKFNVVCQPNDWSKTVAEGALQIERADLTDAKRLQLDFWTEFRRFMAAQGSIIKPTKALPQHWMHFALGKTGFHLTAVASLYDSETESFDSNEIRAEMVMDSVAAKQHFDAFTAMKSQIEAEVGETMTWHNPPDKRSCKVYIRQPAKIEDRARWPEYFKWLLSKLETLHKAFAQRAKQVSENAI